MEPRVPATRLTRVQIVKSSGPSSSFKTFYRLHERGILGATGMIATLLVWQLAWSSGLISPLFFSGPSEVVRRFVTEIASGRLISEALYTWGNFFAGFALALVVAVPAGIVLGWYQRLNMIFEPLMNLFYAMPRIAFYPLIIIWFGIGAGSKIFVIFLSAMLPILINTIAGVRNMDADLVRAARAYCATDSQIFLTLALPSSVPFILTGVRQGVAHGLIGAIIAELFAGSHGLGFIISYAGQVFDTALLLVGVICVAVSGLVLNIAAQMIQNRFERWRPQHH